MDVAPQNEELLLVPRHLPQATKMTVKITDLLFVTVNNILYHCRLIPKLKKDEYISLNC